MVGAHPELAGGRVSRPAPDRDLPLTEVRTAARSGALNLAGAGASAVLGLVLTVAVTRLFSAEVAGVFFVAMSVFLISSTTAGVGAAVGVVYLLARRRATDRVAGLRAVFQVAVPPALVAGLVVAVATWAAGPWLAARMLPESPAAAIPAMRAVALFTPAAVVFTIYVSALRGLGRTRPFVLLERLARPILHLAAVGAVGLAAATGAGLVTAAWAAPYLVLAVAAVVWARRLRRKLERAAGASVPAPPGRADWVEFWRFTGPQAVTGVARIGLQRLDIILIAALLGPAPVALYVAASRFLVVGQLLNQSLGFAVQHRFAALFATGNLPAARQLYQTTTGWLVVGTWPLLLLCVVLAEPILGLFGDGYGQAAAVMRILSAVMLLAVACGMVSMVLEMAGRTVATLAQTLLALAANVVLNLLLIPRWGLVGAAVAWAVAIALNNLIPFAQLHRAYRMQPLGPGTLVAMVAAASCFGLLPGAVAALAGPHPAALGTAIVVGAAGYLAVLWRTRHVLQLNLLGSLRRSPTVVEDTDLAKYPAP